jgi:hypothetical protein
MPKRHIASAVLALSLASASAVFAQVPVGSQAFLAAGLTTTVVIVKGVASSTTPGAVDAVVCGNGNASPAVGYVQFFDAAYSTAVTLGTTVPKMVVVIPPVGAGGATFPNGGVFFQNGIKIAATTTAKGDTALTDALDCTVAFR